MDNFFKKLVPFIGGQVVVDKEFPGEAGFSSSTFCGEIKYLSLNKNILEIELNWAAKCDNNKEWVNAPKDKKKVFKIKKKTSCHCGEKTFLKICFFNEIENETISFSVKENPDNLDPLKVKGLVNNNIYK
ncbi:MAG: hypothetical protein WA101_02685 [Minisyncoccia bacterium]